MDWRNPNVDLSSVTEPVPYVHSTTNHFSVNYAANRAQSIEQQYARCLDNYIRTIEQRQRTLNAKVGNKDFCQMFNNYMDNVKRVDLLTNAWAALNKLSNIFKGVKTWTLINKHVGQDTFTYQYKNNEGMEDYGTIEENFKIIMEAMGFIKDRAVFINEDFDNYCDNLPEIYKTSRNNFKELANYLKEQSWIEEYANGSKKLSDLVTMTNGANGTILTTNEQFRDFIINWQSKGFSPTQAGWLDEVFNRSALNDIGNHIKNKFTAEVIGAAKDERGKQTLAFGDIQINIQGEVFFGSVKTAASNTTHLTHRVGKEWTKVKRTNAIKITKNEGYWLATLYNLGFNKVPKESKGTAEDYNKMANSYYYLMLAYAIRSTLNRLGEENSEVSFLIINEQAVWYSTFLKSYWFDLIEGFNIQSTYERYISPVVFYVTNDEAHYQDKLDFLDVLNPKLEPKKSKRRYTRRKNRMSLVGGGARNFKFLYDEYSSNPRFTGIKFKGLQHVILAQPANINF